MQRALTQIKYLLERIDPIDDQHQDRINASLDDVEFMLSRIKW